MASLDASSPKRGSAPMMLERYRAVVRMPFAGLYGDFTHASSIEGLPA